MGYIAAMNNHPRMFTLYLLEDDFGRVRVVSDYTGEGEHCLAVGIELMGLIAALQPHSNGTLSFVMPTCTDAEH
jgi:hypothetical protein